MDKLVLRRNKSPTQTERDSDQIPLVDIDLADAASFNESVNDSTTLVFSRGPSAGSKAGLIYDSTKYQKVPDEDVQDSKYESLRPDSPNNDGNRLRQLWTPFFLRRGTLIMFAITFAAFLLTVAVLYVYSHRAGEQTGIKAEDKYYYLWTFGPTAG